MQGRILLMDNQADALDKWGRLLEQRGYYVLRAATLEEAETILRDRWLHLAIFDIRMLEEEDPNDIGGLLLSKRPEFRSVPKLILTAYKVFEYARMGLMQDSEGPPAVVNIVAKDEGPQAFLQAVEQAFAEHVHLNQRLIVSWDGSQTLNLPVLASLLEPQLPPYLLPERIAEIDDLLRTLFYNYDHVTVAQPLWHVPDRVAVEGFAYSASEEKQYVIIFRKRAVDQRQPEPGGWTSPERSWTLLAESLHFSATAIAIGGANAESVQTFATFFRQKPERFIRTALESLWRDALAERYRQGRSVETNTSLAQLYRDTFQLADEAAHWAACEIILHEVAKESLTRGIAVITITPERLTIEFPHGRVVSFPNPLWAVRDARLVQVTRAVCGLSYGDLDVETILVDREGHIWPSEQTRGVRAPVWRDFILFELGVHFKLIETDNLQTLIDFEKGLSAATSLAGATANNEAQPEYHKAQIVIQSIRRFAGEIVAQDDLYAYTLGLLFGTLADFRNYGTAARKTKSDLGRWLHRIVFAALQADKLAQLRLGQQPPERKAPTAAGMRVDETNREVFVNDVLIRLAPREFDLLVYLHQRAGKLCGRADIAREVFKVNGGISTDDEKMINTNIGRLRRKLAPAARDHEYIVTVHGVGYKCVLPPTPTEGRGNPAAA